MLSWERFSHLDPENWLNTTLRHMAAPAVPACYFYATLHFIVTPVVRIWTDRSRPWAYRQAAPCLP